MPIPIPESKAQSPGVSGAYGTSSGMPAVRPGCPRCRRPASACWCAGLEPVETTTRVVFLQHPRESRVAIGTARIAHLGLARSELHEGVEFAAHPRLRELISRPGTALLFPGPGAVSPDAVERPPETLLILDGTWPQARKMMALNPFLASLPRIGFLPRRPGNYRIRREPSVHCVATVEAVVEVLAAWEGGEERFGPMIRAFESMVDRQIAARAARTGPPRRHLKGAAPWWESPAMPDLMRLWPRLVVVAGEANAHRRGSGVPGEPELLHWVAMRPSTGEVFEAFLAPRRPLAPGADRHLEVPREALLGGRPVPDGIALWNAFLRPGDRLVAWGGFALRLLGQESWVPETPSIDLRLVAAHRLKRRPGSAAAAAAALGGVAPIDPSARGRAGASVGAQVALLVRLIGERLASGPVGGLPGDDGP